MMGCDVLYGDCGHGGVMRRVTAAMSFCEPERGLR